MRVGGRTPEELETLLEDAVVLADGGALAHLFEDDAVLVTGDGLTSRGVAEIVDVLGAATAAPVADLRHVLQSRDTALVVGKGSTSVLRRGSDGAWRYAISLLSTEGEDR